MINQYPTDYPEEDLNVEDPLQSRHFYELCQQYRHSKWGGNEFEALKNWIRQTYINRRDAP